MRVPLERLIPNIVRKLESPFGREGGSRLGGSKPRAVANRRWGAPGSAGGGRWPPPDRPYIPSSETAGEDAPFTQVSNHPMKRAHMSSLFSMARGVWDSNGYS